MEPFYGDVSLASQLLAWRDALGIKTVVETGTGFACDTQWFCDHFERVLSVEIQAPLAQRARVLLRGRNVEITCGDATKCLPSVVAKVPRGETALYFLNACRSDKPLAIEELRSILQGHPSFVIIVNDVQNPERPDLAHFQWQDKKCLTLDSLKKTLDVYSPGWCHTFLDASPDAKLKVSRLVIYPNTLANNII